MGLGLFVAVWLLSLLVAAATGWGGLAWVAVALCSLGLGLELGDRHRARRIGGRGRG